jgi:hypothetical protein
MPHMVSNNAKPIGVKMMSEIYKREDGSLIFIKYAGGWGYDSSCGRFSIINLAKTDNDESRPAQGWRLIDNKIKDWAGDYPTLKAAKQSAAEINSAA